MEIYVVIRYALWPRLLISGCLFSVATSFAFPPLLLAGFLFWRDERRGGAVLVLRPFSPWALKRKMKRI